MAQPKTISEQLRRALENAPVSRYRIAKDTGIAESVLSRFLRHVCELGSSNIDRLASYFGLELRPIKETPATTPGDTTKATPRKKA